MLLKNNRFLRQKTVDKLNSFCYNIETVTNNAEKEMAQIQIVNGTYRNKSVAGRVFELVAQFQQTAKSAFVTVKNNGQFPGFPETIRVNVTSPQDYTFVSGEAAQIQSAPESEVVTETDDEAIARIRDRFEILTDMTKAATNGDIRAMIVSGPPGVGKSHGVEQEIEKACLFDKIAGKRLRAEVVKGSAPIVTGKQIGRAHV